MAQSCERCDNLAAILEVEPHQITGKVYNLTVDEATLERIADYLVVPKGGVEAEIQHMAEEWLSQSNLSEP